MATISPWSWRTWGVTSEVTANQLGFLRITKKYNKIETEGYDPHLPEILLPLTTGAKKQTTNHPNFLTELSFPLVKLLSTSTMEELCMSSTCDKERYFIIDLFLTCPLRFKTSVRHHQNYFFLTVFSGYYGVAVSHLDSNKCFFSISLLVFLRCCYFFST